MDKFYSRTIGLIKEEGVLSLLNKKVAVFGVGGVGGTCLEALTRSGVGQIDIFDFDVVDESNLNRQICFDSISVGKEKVLIAKEKMNMINPSVEIVAHSFRLDIENVMTLDLSKFDYVVDCIDETKPKIELIKRCIKEKIKIVSSLGMANRLDPSKVCITTLDKTYNDPLAKLIRNKLKSERINTKLLPVAFSSELPIKNGTFKGSMMLVPSSAGLSLAYKVIFDLI